ncbi:hypothetical protein ABZ490_38485 [Streptomyces sp. NPDC005811]|uniref:hypothetical protein n=1 Tax=Streptomyces sp. NPDC005811 TaxID=3154565 RepID=UPI0033D78A87
MSAMPLGAVIMVWTWLNCSAAASAEKMTVVRLTGRLRGPGEVVNDRRFVLVGLLTAYVAYKWKGLATPVTVGAVVVTLLVLLLQGQDEGSAEHQLPPASCVYEAERCHRGGGRDTMTPTISTQDPVRQ